MHYQIPKDSIEKLVAKAKAVSYDLDKNDVVSGHDYIAMISCKKCKNLSLHQLYECAKCESILCHKCSGSMPM